MSEQQPMKLIVAYDRDRNEYSIAAHNQQAEEADRFLEKWSPHLRPESSFIVLAQAGRHETEDSQRCRACRDTVARSANLQPKPKFKRRKE